MFTRTWVDDMFNVWAGALALQPANAALWAAMGAVADRRNMQEYSLSRALELEPRSASAWAALARIYLDGGHVDLAAHCLELGRNHEPTSGAVWEAMGALAGASATGTVGNPVLGFCAFPCCITFWCGFVKVYEQASAAGGTCLVVVSCWQSLLACQPGPLQE